MPPSDGSSMQSHHFPLAAPIANGDRRRIKINVGGRIFETTSSTVRRAGSRSLLGQIGRTGDGAPPTFIDRDPDLFSILLSAIRTGNLPATAAAEEEFSADELIEEARFYGVEELLKSAMAPPTLDGIDTENVGTVAPSGRDRPSALAPGPDGSLWVSHGNKITVYDWALRRLGTALTGFDRLDCLHRIGPTHAVGGSVDSPGLPVYDVVGGRHEKTILWRDGDDPRIYDATVQSVCSSDERVFASFESRGGENAIVAVDKRTLEIVSEVGRENGGSARLTAAKKLEWLPSRGLLLASAVRGGAFGYCGYMRLWDPRCDRVVWERNEPGGSRGWGCFADVAASEAWSALFKVGVAWGGVAMADIRRLDLEEPWMFLEDANPMVAKGEGGAHSRVVSHDGQVFCSRGADVEVWSSPPSELAEGKVLFKRNFVGPAVQGCQVSHLEVGGNRMFIGREGSGEIEVRESRRATRGQKLAQIYPL